MISKWYELKPKAIAFRQKGKSLREIEKKLKIPRSTLSGWLKAITLSDHHQSQLKNNHDKALVKARWLAVKWHNQQKELRIREAQKEGDQILANLEPISSATLDLAAAMLYLGEGFKKSNSIGLGNSNPLILKFFVRYLLKREVPLNKIKCELHLRYDQNPEQIKKYWSRVLAIPVSNFVTVSVDLRTKDRPTYAGYQGVCVIRCGLVAIQRRLLYLSEQFCKKVIHMRA